MEAAGRLRRPPRRGRSRIAERDPDDWLTGRTCAHPQAAPSGPKPRTSPAPDPTSSPPATWSTHGATPATSNNPLTRVLGAFHRELVLQNGEHHCPWPQGAVNTRVSPAPGRPRIQHPPGYPLGTHTPVNSRCKPGNRPPIGPPENPLVCREIPRQRGTSRSACHAEGRGFESLQPLGRKLRGCGAFRASGVAASVAGKGLGGPTTSAQSTADTRSKPIRRRIWATGAGSTAGGPRTRACAVVSVADG